MYCCTGARDLPRARPNSDRQRPCIFALRWPPDALGDAALNARSLTRALAAYREPNSTRSILELMITAVPFFAIWAAMAAAVESGHWVALLLVLPAAGLLVRLFIIQHDCGHRSFFAGRFANDWVGRALGVLTLTPYDYWRRSHALHHANSGDLDRVASATSKR